MQLRQALKIRFAWMVCFTIFAAALLPTLSHFVLPANSAAWAEVCTATGAKFVRVDMGPESPDPAGSSATASMDCAWCALHHGPPLLPPAPPAWEPPGALAFERPQLFFSAPRPLFAWAPSLARGPPSLS